jgi:hypothetical protein
VIIKVLASCPIEISSRWSVIQERDCMHVFQAWQQNFQTEKIHLIGSVHAFWISPHSLYFSSSWMREIATVKFAATEEVVLSQDWKHFGRRNWSLMKERHFINHVVLALFAPSDRRIVLENLAIQFRKEISKFPRCVSLAFVCSCSSLHQRSKCP